MQFGMIGSGSWATALAKILTDNGNTINWFIRSEKNVTYMQKRRHNPHYLGSAYFDVKQLQLTCNLEDVISNSDALVIAVPSAYVIDVLSSLPKEALQNKKIISAIKGLLPSNNQLLNEYLYDNFNVPL